MNRLRSLEVRWRRSTANTHPALRKLLVAFVGGAVLFVGAAMIVLPGPAVVVMPAGLAILATEFSWARRLLRSVRRRFVRLRSSARAHHRAHRRAHERRRAATAPPPVSDTRDEGPAGQPA